MSEQLPAIQMVVPLLAAPLCLILRKPRLCWGLALGVTWFSFAVAGQLMSRALAASEPISYHLGGFAPPHGIELRVDVFNAFLLLIVTGISAIVLTASPRSLREDVPVQRHYLFFAAYLLCMTGLLGMSITGDAFNIFVFLEISSLSSYTLIAMGPTRRAVRSALTYLMMGTLGGTFILLGVGLLYSVTGTLNIADLARRIDELGLHQNRTVWVASAAIVVGTSIKLAVFPLHGWLPNAYTFAPAVVTALLAATSTKVAFYVLTRFLYGVFGTDLAFGAMHLDAVLLPLAVLAMFIGSLVAIYQKDIKRMLAYSSIAQVGYMVLGLSLTTKSGLAGGIAHLFNHAMTKSGLFLALACIALRVGSTQLEDFRGLGRRMPFTMGAFVLGGLSLIGVPLTAGFVSKLLLVRGAFEAGLWPVAVMILLSSLLAVIYVWRVVEVAYFQEGTDVQIQREEAPLSLLVPTCILVGATLFFGIFTSFSAGIAERAAALLIGGGS